MIYPPVIGHHHDVESRSGLAGTVTLLASAIGGWLDGYLCDRIGRVKTLQIAIIRFSFFSLVCAFVQNFDQLLVARALLRLVFGGEWAAGAALMGEVIRPQYRGRAVGSVQSTPSPFDSRSLAQLGSYAQCTSIQEACSAREGNISCLNNSYQRPILLPVDW